MSDQNTEDEVWPRREIRPVLREELHYECPVCLVWYVPWRTDQIYCGAKCRGRAAYVRKLSKGFNV